MGLNHKRTHDDNRNALCLLCLKRGRFRVINETLKVKIRNLVPAYNPENECLPRVVCNTCMTYIYRGKEIEKQPDFSNFVLKIKTRSQLVGENVPCDCHLCSLARLPPNANFSKNGKCLTDESCSKVFSANSAIESSTSGVGRVVKAGKIERRCSKCLTSLKQGVQHRCNKSSLLKNISTALNDTSGTKGKEQLTARLLKEIQDENPEGDNKLEKPVSLTQLKGKPLKIKIKTKRSSSRKKTLLTVKDFLTIKTSLNLSSRSTEGVATVIRTAIGNRKVVEKDLKQKLKHLTHRVDNFFDVDEMQFIYTKKDSEVACPGPLVYCKDLQSFLDFIKNKRGLTSVHLKFGIDAGQGFLKVCVSVLPEEKERDNSEKQMKKRQPYENGIQGRKFRASGVKKVLILAIAPHTQENYENASILWTKLSISNFDGTIATDLKLANILVGIMSHSSSHPCTWCEADKTRLYESGAYRTVGSCMHNYSQWVESGAKKKDAQKFQNCVHPPVFNTDEDSLIIDLIPPPELHLLLGTVNTIYDHMYREFQEDAERWAKNCHVQRAMTHGSPAFDGNSCNILLHNVDILRRDSLGCLKYVEVLQRFKQVVDSCFTVILKDNYAEVIDLFKDSFSSLDIPITPKIHAVFFHVIDFCSRHGRGLGYFSEQAMESVHHDFDQTWKKFKVLEVNPHYRERLLRAVCEYNSSHI